MRPPRIRALLCRRFPHDFRIRLKGSDGWELRCARCGHVGPTGKRSTRYADWPRAGQR